MPLPPPFPPHISRSDFGHKVTQRGTGDVEARARILTLSREELQAAGVTRAMAQQWRDFYREEARLRPANPSARGRADLMQRAMELLDNA